MHNSFAVASDRKFTGRQLWFALLLLSGIWMSALGAAPVNDNFASARQLLGTSGSISATTAGSTRELGEPAHVVAGGTNAVWCRWTAPASGSVIFTTTDVTTVFDTVVAIYTGTSVSNLIEVASNNNSPSANATTSSYVQFTAIAGTTYRIAVGGVAGATGNFLLRWTMGGDSGTFGWTDSTYEATDRESQGVANISNAMAQRDIPGARLTITRRDGASGRVKVDYAIFNGVGGTFGTTLNTDDTLNSRPVLDVTQTSPIPASVLGFTNGNVDNVLHTLSVVGTLTNGTVITLTNAPGFPAAQIPTPVNPLLRYYVTNVATAAGVSTFQLFGPLSGSPAILTTLTGPPPVTASNQVLVFNGLVYTNSVIFDDWQMSSSILLRISGTGAKAAALQIQKVSLMPGESTALLAPKIDATRNNSTLTVYPTSVGANFLKTRWQIQEYGGTATLRVLRGSGIPDGGVTSVQVNGRFVAPSNGQNTPGNNIFPLASGSDYASPGEDFNSINTTISWGQGVNFNDVNIGILDDNIVEFNEDFRVDLFTINGQTGTPGPSDHAYVTIMVDDRVNQEQAAGTVDPSYNRDYYNLSNPPYNATPGANDQVQAVEVDSNNRAIIGGDFTAVNGDASNVRLVRMTAAGDPDSSFVVGSGPNSSVLAITSVGNSVYIVGKFSSYNASQAKGVARLNANGSLDGTFNIGSGVLDPLNTPVRALAVHTNGVHAGKVVIVGDFNGFGAQNWSRIARVTSTGAADSAGFNPGQGANGPIYTVKILTGALNGYILVAGDFTTFDNVSRNRIARLRPDGSLDTSFDPGGGANGAIYSMDVQSDGSIVLGGSFTSFDLHPTYRIARILSNGQFDSVFETGYGFDDTVYSVKIDSTGLIYFGGLFRQFNQVRRAGYARLLSSGYLDTEFMDTAYNHYAGLPMRFSPLAEAKPYVRAMALQTNGDILIGGSFQRIGGGVCNTRAELNNSVTGNPISTASPWRSGADTPVLTPIWQSRDDIRNRSNFACVKGGATPGPGNIGFVNSTYSVDEAAGQLFVTLSRDNTDTPALSQVTARFRTANQPSGPGAAQDGLDYVAVNSVPTWSSFYNNQLMISYASTGPNNTTGGNTSVQYIPIISDGLIEGNETFKVTLDAPKNTLELGGQFSQGEGEVIPVGVALGRATALVNIIDDDVEPTYIGFSQPRYSVGEDGVSATITVTRSGSTTRSVSVDYLATEHLGLAGNDPEETASDTLDFQGVSARLTFLPGQTSLTFTIPIYDDVIAEGDESLNLYLFNLSPGVSFSTTRQTVVAVNDSTHPTRPNSFDLAGHGFYNDTEVRFTSALPNGMPTGIATNTSYYVLINPLDSSYFQVSASPGGPPIAITAAGTGALYVDQVQNLSRLTIYDNDFSSGSLRFSTTTKYSVSEGKTVTVTVQRTGGNVGAIEVGYSLMANTATGGGADYNDVSGKLTWSHLDSAPKSFTITTVVDGLVEGTEDFTVNLTQPRRVSDDAVVPTPAGTTIPVEIIDADSYGALKFASANFSVSENGGKAIITVVRTGGSSGTVQADVVDLVSGTAVNPTHYNFVSPKHLILGPGVTSANFTVDLVDDVVQNPSRTINFVLTSFINATGPDDNTTLTIIDNESVNAPAGSVDTTYNAAAGPDNFIQAMALQADEKLLIGGDFKQVNGISQTRISRLLTSGQIDTTFTSGSGASDSIRSIVVQEDGRILIGGLFTNYNGSTFGHIARLRLDGTVDTTFDTGAGADNPVLAMAVHQDPLNRGKVIVGGQFSMLGSLARPYVARVDTNGIIDQAFNTGTGPDDAVYAVAIDNNGRILIGGAFKKVNQNTNYPYLARLNPDGSLDTTFSTANQLDGAVRAIAIQSDGKIVVGGNFVNAGSSPRHYVARLDTDGTLDAGFGPEPGGDSPVFTIALQPDGKVVLGGDFQTFSGVTRRRLTRLNEDGSVDVNINFGAGANNFISSVVIQPSDGKIIAGGSFSKFDGFARNNLVRLHGGVLGGSGTIEIDAPTYLVSEAVTNAVVTVRRKGGTQGTVGINYSVLNDSTRGDTALGTGPDADFIAIPTGTLVFPPGETEAVIQIQIVGDTLPEGTETFTVQLAALPLIDPNYAPLGNQPYASVSILDNDTEIAFQAASYNVLENDPTGAILVPVVRLIGLDGTLSVQVVSSNGTAIAGQDYVAVNQQVTFLPGDTIRYIPVTILNDSIGEPNESFTLQLINPVGDGRLGAQSSTTVTINDDDFTPGVIQFETALITVDENAGLAELKLVRTNGSSGILVVNYATVQLGAGQAIGGVTINSPNDFLNTNGSVTFADGETMKSIFVQILRDSDTTETNESFQVQLSDPYRAGASLGFPNPATVTIINNNSAIFGQFSIDPLVTPFNEGTTTPIVVKLTGRQPSVTQTLSVDYTVVGVTATAGSDFVVASGTLNFAAIDISKSFSFTALTDNLVEGPETFQVILSNPRPGNGPSIATPVTTGTIISTEQFPGTIVFSQPIFTGTENSQKVDIVLQRTNGVQGAVSVDLTLTPGTATPGQDYVNFVPSPRVVTWADGVGGAQTVSIVVNNDVIVEADETIQLTLSNPTGSAVIGTTTAVAVILDDEVKAGSVDTAFAPTMDGPVYALAMWPATNRITAVGDFRTVNTFVRSNVAQLNLDGTLFPNFNPGVLSLGGTNASVRTVLTYTNGSNTGKVIIGGRFDSVNGVAITNIARLNADGTVDTTFNVGAGPNAPVNTAILQVDGKVIIGGDFNLVDTNSANFLTRLNPNGSIDAGFNIGAGADAPINTLCLLGNGDIIVGGDFSKFSSQSSARLTRLTTTGSLVSAFSTNLGLGFDNSVFALATQADGTILVGGGFTKLNGVDCKYLVNLNPNGTRDTVNFINTGDSFNDSVFALAVQDDGRILAAGNFTTFNFITHNRIAGLKPDGSIDPTINFGTGADSFINTIQLQPDNKILIGGGFKFVDGFARTSLARLNNGTNGGSGVLQFAVPEFIVNENDSSAKIVVSRILGTAQSVSVDVVTIDGTAASPLHYQGVTNTVVFAEGETSREIAIPIIDDIPAAVNANRQFYLALRNPTNNVGVAPFADPALLGTRTNSTVTIVDNESVVSFAATSFVVAENGVNAVITLTRVGGSNDPVSVQFQTTTGTATAGVDYQAISNTVVWTAGDLAAKTILIPIVNDAFVEGIETVDLQLANFTGSSLPGITNSVLSIIDDDFSAGTIGFELSSYNVLESQMAQVVVVRTNGNSGIVSVQLTTSNNTAIAGADYLGTNILVTFANGETRKVINIATYDDSILDDLETFFVHLSPPSGGAVLGLADTTVTIDDNDVQIGFTTNSVHVAESNTSLQLTVTRSGLLTRTFIINYATANGNAQAGLDYTQTNGVLVFGPNETNKTIDVQILGDFIIEGPETFTVGLSGTNLSLSGITTTTVTIDDNDVATDLEVLVSVNNPVKTNSVVQYSLLVTNYGPSDISGVILTNLLPASLQIQSISVTNVSTNGNALIFDLPIISKGSGYSVLITALDTNGIIRSVTNVASLGLPSSTNDINLANNIVTNVTKLRGPGAYIGVDSLTLVSETPGPANGAFDIGEQVTVAVTFRNLGDLATTAATASLLGTGGVVTNTGPQNATLGAMAPNATVTRNFTFSVTGTNGGALIATINLADTGAVTYDPAILRYRLGGSASFGTTNGIVINDNSSATPYPATLNVAGLVGVVDQVSLTLSNVYHTFPADIDLLLVSPSGQSALVMSDAGSGNKLVNTTFTITDLASVDLPNNGQILNNGSYRPKDYVNPTPGDDAFAAPAPVGPYFTSMAAFKGIDPNGVWQLYVRDDSTGDFGVISNGWALNISTVFPANSTAGLVVSGTQSAGPVLVGADLTYTIIVTNHGPNTVGSAFLTNLFSSPFTVVTATNTAGGAATLPSGRVILALGALTNGATVTNVVTVHPTTASTFTNLVTVGIASGETDPFLGDNSIIFSQVVGANADLAVSVATSPAGPVALGNNLTYTVTLTNLGPSTATSVVLTNVLPANVNYVSGSASQGVVARSGSLVTATLGSLAPNGSAQLTITVTPMVSGSLTNTVTASSAVNDSNPLNNQAVTTTTAVTDSADLKISLTGSPSPVTLGSNITYTITVTNLGPSTASGVVVTNPLPGAVTLVSFTNSQGSAANVSGAVVFTLGSVPTGTNVTMQVVVTANAVGAVNSTAIVSASGTFDPVSGNNSATTAIAVQSLAADIDIGASLLLSESIAPANGALDPGETVTVRLELANKGAAATGNLVATLLPTGGVTTNSGPQVKTYGAIASGSSASQNYTFKANGNLGDTLSATLQLQDGATSLGTVTFTFQLGETVRGGSGTAIIGVDVGPALTYPSIVNISGISGTILKATVTLTNVTHTFPDDFDILLVSPTGKKVILMSDAGGGFAINGINVTFDDSAASALPDSGQITDGVYRPSNYLNSPVDSTSTNDVFAAPAPAGPYDSTLANFVGENPNGDWKLYVMDDQTGNVGTVGGWSLSLVTVSTIAPSADVAVAVTATPNPVGVRSNLTYTITVTNSGPNSVSGVTVTNTLPASASLVSLATAQGTIATNSAGRVVWTIGSMAANAQYQALIVAAPQVPGSVTNVTTVTHTDIELNNANNTATVITSVSGVVLSGGSLTVSPSTISLMLLGQPNVTYTIEASTDLVTWTVIGTSTTNASGIITINDLAGSTGGLRFYRAHP